MSPLDGGVTDLTEKFGETVHALFSPSILLGGWIGAGELMSFLRDGAPGEGKDCRDWLGKPIDSGIQY